MEKKYNNINEKTKEKQEVKNTELELKVKTALNTFNNLGIKYTVDSIDFLMGIEKSLSELRIYTEANCLLLISAGLPDKTINKGKEALVLLMDKGLDLQTIHTLCLEKAQEQGFMLGEMGMKILNEMSENPDKQVIASVPFLQELTTMMETMNLTDLEHFINPKRKH